MAFESLGQYDRKLRKPSIQIALQCDSTETGIAVGWHEDWLQEERERRALRTDSSWKEYGLQGILHDFKYIVLNRSTYSKIWWQVQCDCRCIPQKYLK